GVTVAVGAGVGAAAPVAVGVGGGGVVGLLGAVMMLEARVAAPVRARGRPTGDARAGMVMGTLAMMGSLDAAPVPRVGEGPSWWRWGGPGPRSDRRWPGLRGRRRRGLRWG